VALSQVYMAGRFCEALVERVLPPSDPDRKHQPRSAIVALNDHHLLGKRIVYAQMRASGFELFDYGRMDVPELVANACRPTRARAAGFGADAAFGPAGARGAHRAGAAGRDVQSSSAARRFSLDEAVA
jgi:methanogenic corrinoid protein MtbC1